MLALGGIYAYSFDQTGAIHKQILDKLPVPEKYRALAFTAGMVALVFVLILTYILAVKFFD
jgi:hypothetical protein